MAGFVVVLFMAGFVSVCFAEPWTNLSRSLHGDGVFNDPGVVRLLGWIEIAAGVSLFCVHLYRD